MAEAISGIVRLGLINSGMFDALELNADVRAMHLVGDNNVGKTSLIEVIQFLYFPDLREMRFSKSPHESIAFYFRPEGSYILFTVRTLLRKLRTLGVYGTGSADSRKVFVFDGPFQIHDFLDSNRRVLPLTEVGRRFADRRWHIYESVEDHERALIGEHTNDAANVHLFDLDRAQFRLLRKALQHLLRLDRLTANNIRQFLNALVESAGARTRIDVARDFTERHQRVRTIRERIYRLQQLKPLADSWNEARQRHLTAQAEEQMTRRLLTLIGKTCIDRLQRQTTMLGEQLTAIGLQRQTLMQQQQQLALRLADAQVQQKTLEQTLARLAQLRRQCADASEAEVRAERDMLQRRILELQRQQMRLHQVDVKRIEQRLHRARREHEELQRRLASQTIDQMLADCNLSDEQRALVHFLFSDRLRGLPVNETVQDADRLLQTVYDAASRLDDQGAFVGFGLSVSRDRWRRAPDDEEPLSDQLERRAQEVDELERELDLARNQRQVQTELQQLQQQVDALEEAAQDWRRLRDIERESGGETALHASLARSRADQADILAQQEQIGKRLADCQEQEITLRTHIRHLDQRSEDIRRSLADLAPVDHCDDADLDQMSDDELFRRWYELQKEHAYRARELRRSEEEVRHARARLEDVYDRDSADQLFDDWLATKQEQISAMPQLEAQLREQYVNLIAQVKGELDALAKAFDMVRERIAELNQSIRQVGISNIARIELAARESEIITAIRQIGRLQLDLFSAPDESMGFAEAERLIEDRLASVFQSHGREMTLDRLFDLEFRVTFATGEQRAVSEIHDFESNGTAIGVKIVIYLGLIRLLQSRRRMMMRIPFFLDEAGSLSSNNVRQIIRYCDEHHFLPIFASPAMRSDISHTYVLRRNGDRSVLVNELILTEPEGD